MTVRASVSLARATCPASGLPPHTMHDRPGRGFLMAGALRGLLVILAATSLGATLPPPRSSPSAGWRLVDQLHRERPNSKGESWSPIVLQLIALGEAAVPALEQGLRSHNDHVSDSCGTALARIGGSAIDVFLRALASTAPRTRKAGLVGLAYVEERTPSGSLKIRNALIPLVRAKDPETRHWAVYGLQRFGDRESVLLIVEALQDPSSRVRRTAALALRTTGDDIAGPALIKAFESEDSELRADVAAALGFRHRDPGAFQALWRHRADPSPRVRWTIVNVLPNFGGKRSMKYLAAFLDDDTACEFGKASEAAASIICKMIDTGQNHSPESVEMIRRWWEATGSSRYGGLEVPDPGAGFIPAFIPSRILPEGWEFLFAETCPAPPGWTAQAENLPAGQDGTCRHYRYWHPCTPSPERTAPYFDLYLVPLSWSGESRSGNTRVTKGTLASGAPEAADPPEARFLGKSGQDLVFWYSDRLGDWEKAPADFRAYLKAQ